LRLALRALELAAFKIVGQFRNHCVNILMDISYDQNAIRVIDHAVSDRVCQQVIDLYQRDHRRHRVDGDRYIELDVFGASKDWRSQPFITEWQPLVNEILTPINQAAVDYRQRWDPLAMMPERGAMEGVRIKRYEPGQHEFRLHVDQGDRGSSRRYLACLVYLEDNAAGTEFPLESLTVDCLAGRMVLFPPTWQYPHRGIMPTDSTKYIISTYWVYT